MDRPLLPRARVLPESRMQLKSRELIKRHLDIYRDEQIPTPIWKKSVMIGLANGLDDFLSLEMFRSAAHNSRAAERLLEFSQSRFCGENVEFIQELDHYNIIVSDLKLELSKIYTSFISSNSPREINISHEMVTEIESSINFCFRSLIPSLESIFTRTKEHIEMLLYSNIYAPFVQTQIAMSTMKALSNDRGKYPGLGDCFCLTNPRHVTLRCIEKVQNKPANGFSLNDNPIILASDGFVDVTGYSRDHIIPQNCRFLRGNNTDRHASQRLKISIDAGDEIVEILVNYKANGEPFLNLLYITPLRNTNHEVVFFLGCQINCSTTLYSREEILSILSTSVNVEEINESNSSTRSTTGINNIERSEVLTAESIFKSASIDKKKDFWSSIINRLIKDKKYHNNGMEQDLLHQIEERSFQSQGQMFYTAYSKYLILSYDHLEIQFYSMGAVNMLSPGGPTLANLVGRNIFKVLKERVKSISRHSERYIRRSLQAGHSVSANMGHLDSVCTTVDTETIGTHWTPLKNEKSFSKLVVLILGPAISVY